MLKGYTVSLIQVENSTARNETMNLPHTARNEIMNLPHTARNEMMNLPHS